MASTDLTVAAPVPQTAEAPSTLSHVIAHQLETFSTVFPRVLTGDDPKDVHDLRASTRRLQEALAVLSSSSRPKAAKRHRRTLRRVRRALGSWRNLDVALEELRDRRRGTRSALKRAGWDLVRDYLGQRRVDETIRARKQLVRENLAGFRGHVEAIADELLRDSSPSAAWQAVSVRVEDAWSEWSEALSRARETTRVDTVHALRIATKRLRYRVELARELDAQGAEPVLGWTRRVQKELGDWHDQQVCRQLVAEALARPEVLLDRLDVVRTVLDEIDRERRRAQPVESAALARVAPEEGRKAVEAWLARARERI